MASSILSARLKLLFRIRTIDVYWGGPFTAMLISYRILARLFLSTILIHSLGCARSHKPALPQEIHRTVKSLGIVTIDAEADSNLSGATAGNLAKRGAAAGASGPAALCSMGGGGYGALLCVVMLPVAVIGAGVGAVVGANISQPEEQVLAAGSAIKAVANDIPPGPGIGAKLVDQFEKRARIPTIELQNPNSNRPHGDIDYRAFTDYAIDAVLEVRVKAFSMDLWELEPDPLVTVKVVVNASLVRVSDGELLISHPFSGDSIRRTKKPGLLGNNVEVAQLDSSHSFYSMAADDAALFRKELGRIYEQLANDIFKFYRNAVRGQYTSRTRRAYQ